MKFFTFYLFICFLILSPLSAQVAYISGNVSTPEGDNLAGVTIMIQGTTQGTITDLDGNYSIVVPGPGTVLVFSFVGFITQAVPVRDQTVINVMLSPDVKLLKDVVIVGYTEQSIRNVSGSVSKIDPKTLSMIPSSNVAEQLQGMAPGVLSLFTGRPGGAVEVRIRGFTTLNNNRPLWVIDGNPTLDGYRFLNTNDIESLQVLKDASTASIYGSRAANGVILVTTKKPKIGAPSFSFDTYIGIQTVPKTLPEILNPTERMEVEKSWLEGYKYVFSNDSLTHGIYTLSDGSWGLPDYLIPNSMDPSGWMYLGHGYSEALDGPLDISNYDYYIDSLRYTRTKKSGTDWLDEVFNPALIQNYNFTVQYGTDKGSLYSTIGYFNQQGILKYNDFKKFSFRINGTLNLGKRVNFGENVGFTYEKSLVDYINPNTPDQSKIISQIISMPQIFPIYDVGGNFSGVNGMPKFYANNFYYEGRDFDTRLRNPLGLLERIQKDNHEAWYNLMGSFFFEIEPVEGLKLKSSFNPTFRAMPEYKKFDYKFPEDPIYWEEEASEMLNGSLTQVTKNNYYWSWYNTLVFERFFREKHNLKILLGTEHVYNKYMFTKQIKTGYASYDPDYRELENGQKSLYSLGNAEEWALFSLFSRIDYDFSGKYLFSATIRRDGSSRFAPGNRYGIFPAFSAAWRISGENFMKDISLLSDLKIRGSWGQTGNQEIPTDRVLDRFQFSQVMASYSIDGNNTAATLGVIQSFVGNPDMQWETTTSTDFGIDIGLFDNRLMAGFDWYVRKTTGILQEVPTSTLQSNSFEGNTYFNADTMLNKGIDAYLQYTSSPAKDLTLSFGINLSHYKNEVIYVIPSSATYRGRWYPGATDQGIINYVYSSSTEKGHPLASFTGYQVVGIFQDSIDVFNSPIQNDWRQGVSRDSVAYKWLVGTWKYEDVDKNDTIDSRDRKILGSPHPEFVIGVPVMINYKKFDFSLFLYGAFGHKINNQMDPFNQKKMLGSWGMPGVDSLNAELPKAGFVSWISNSYFIEDASFLRLRQVTLGYTFNTTHWKYIRKFRAYVQALNLFTLTKYTGMDPMVSINFENDMEIGTDYGQYPSSAALLLGFNVTF